MIACSIKEHGEQHYKFTSRHCVDGSSQLKGIDFESSYSPTASASSVRTLMCYSAIFRLILGLLDVVNCFQSTLVPSHKRILVTSPPKFIQWYKWRYPEHKLPHSPSGRYAIQILRGLQGDREIGREWYLFLRTMLVKFGCKQCAQELALYYFKRGSDILLINTSTDDFLCAYSDVKLFHDLRNFMTRYVDVTTQEGPIIKYLNLRIVQSDYGVSFDQTEHIRDSVLIKWLPQAGDYVKGYHTPWRTDREAERVLSETLPAEPHELKALEKKYGGSHAALNGQFMHIMVWSRMDIAYAVARLSRYAPVASEATFDCLKRVARFLFYHPHRPIMYPRTQMASHHILRNNFDSVHFAEMKITNAFAVFADGDHGGDQRTRRSLSSILVTLGGVAVDWKVEQQGCISISSTDSEVQSTFTGTKRALYFFDVARFLDMPSAGEPIRIYQDSQPCIDIVTSGSISKRVKHIAVPVHFIYEKVFKRYIDFEHIPTALQPADPGTKSVSAPVLFRACDYAAGVRFYPPATSEHAELMALSTFNAARNFTIPNAPPAKPPTDETPTALLVANAEPLLAVPADLNTDDGDTAPTDHVLEDVPFEYEVLPRSPLLVGSGK